ncbi:MAG: hypothetical protein IPQ16_11000 [Geobacteraceae bacterium]|nr:hypothetical protein [Geobacteraceae bacterium]
MQLLTSPRSIFLSTGMLDLVTQCDGTGNVVPGQYTSIENTGAMEDTHQLKISRHRTFAACLLLAVLLCLAGCASTRPPAAVDATLCTTAAGELPSQHAPDDCRRELCLDGRLTVVEELTETAAVFDWAEEGFCLMHPIDCFRALSVKDHVRQWEQDKAAAGLWDRASLQSGPGDAARHAYLGCLLTERFSEAFARGLLGPMKKTVQSSSGSVQVCRATDAATRSWTCTIMRSAWNWPLNRARARRRYCRPSPGSAIRSVQNEKGLHLRRPFSLAMNSCQSLIRLQKCRYADIVLAVCGRSTSFTYKPQFQ